MASKQISVEFDLLLPNEFLVDHDTTEGKTIKCKYDGPDKIYLQIGENGREIHGPLTEDNILDGRPMPADVVEWYEVDCSENPLLCQLRGPINNQLQVDYTGEEYHPATPEIEGFPRYKYPTPLKPHDVYDKYNITVVDGEVNIPRFSVIDRLHARDTDLTWDEIRAKRDGILESSDSRVTSDMPTALQDAWKEYRQKLRDFPEIMQANGVTPNWAYYMFPEDPNAHKEPINGPIL